MFALSQECSLALHCMHAQTSEEVEAADVGVDVDKTWSSHGGNMQWLDHSLLGVSVKVSPPVIGGAGKSGAWWSE